MRVLITGTRRGRNKVILFKGLFRQCLFGCLAEYKDNNGANRLTYDPIMRRVVGREARFRKRDFSKLKLWPFQRRGRQWQATWEILVKERPHQQSSSR